MESHNIPEKNSLDSLEGIGVVESKESLENRSEYIERIKSDPDVYVALMIVERVDDAVEIKTSNADLKASYLSRLRLLNRLTEIKFEEEIESMEKIVCKAYVDSILISFKEMLTDDLPYSSDASIDHNSYKIILMNKELVSDQVLETYTCIVNFLKRYYLTIGNKMYAEQADVWLGNKSEGEEFDTGYSQRSDEGRNLLQKHKDELLGLISEVEIAFKKSSLWNVDWDELVNQLKSSIKDKIAVLNKDLL